MTTDTKGAKEGYMGWVWGAARDYARHSYPISYMYGKVRGAAQPWISTKFDAQEVADGVFIGDIASASNAKQLKTLGVTHVITAILGVSPPFPKEFTYLNIPVMDVETEDITPYLRNATEFIDKALHQGGKVFVHCMCGVSRSATVVAAWLMTRKHWNVDDTIREMRSRRGCINPNRGFREQLEKFAKDYQYINSVPLDQTSNEDPAPDRLPRVNSFGNTFDFSDSYSTSVTDPC